jgi:hypothetical protein
VGIPPRRPGDSPLSAKVDTKIGPPSGGRSVGIVRLRTKSHGVQLMWVGACKGRSLYLLQSLGIPLAPTPGGSHDGLADSGYVPPVHLHQDHDDA